MLGKKTISRKYVPAMRVAGGLLSAAIMRRRTPLYVGLFITEKCNLKCIYCFPDSPNRVVKDLSKEQIFKIVDALYGMGTRYITLLGGEPMIRKDFGEIVDYIVGKGIMTETGTNGYFTKNWIPTLKKLYLVCHSIDGDETSHDLNRGKGSYNKIVESLQMCKDNGIPVQMRAVFNKNNVGALEYLLKLSREFGTSLALAEQAVVKTKDKEYAMTNEEIREFWMRVRDYKRQGYQIDKSYTLLDKIINFPTEIPYSKLYMKGERVPFKGDFPACNLSRGYCFIDADGFMYPCATLFGKFGKNIFEVGVKEAWDFLDERQCLFCRQSIQDLKSYFFSRDLRSKMVVARNFLSK
ncbi:MAG: radical SAM protein [Deltaproteobacteria bacterium]|nr:radical SAM protein [Deltaproteobacteria bacterium]